jgi:hypothetical protein
MFAPGRSCADGTLFSVMLAGLAATIGGRRLLVGRVVVRYGWIGEGESGCGGVNR